MEGKLPVRKIAAFQLPAGSLDLGLNNLYLWSTVIIFPLVYKTKSLGLAIVSGAAVFALLQAVL